ncbi:S8 family serine peptidase [Glycomyces buryatensis]|nr:S8 family serine peptidase [Glycomyces buryatensis]
MATPLIHEPSRWPHRTSGLGRRAIGAGLGALALAGAIVATPSAALAQDDLAAANAWVTDQIQADGAWATTRGEGVTVAVVDTGVGEHPFFEDKDILPGYTTFSEEGEGDAWNDTDGHGSSVIAGVLYTAPEATILPVRIATSWEIEGLTGGAGGQTDIDAIKWAVDNGADVVAFPWGIISGAGPDEAILEVFQYALDQGVVMVASAGNDPDLEPVPFPASIPGVVAVSGADQSGDSWDLSTTGPEVVVAAPADEMTHPIPQGEEVGWGDDSSAPTTESGEGGTSLGAGIVSGVVALTLAADSNLDGNNAINRLIQTAGDGSGENHTEELGYGLVNADQAVNAEGIETVDENPLGYPLGAPSASGEGEGEDTESEDGSNAGEPSAAAADEDSDSGLSAIIVVAAAVVLIGAAIAVWLVLRGRSRKTAAANGQPDVFNPQSGPVQGGYQQPGPGMQQEAGSGQQQYSPPPMNLGQPGQPGQPAPQGYGGPPSGGPQAPSGAPGFSPPPSPPANNGESGAPWGPSDPNRR